MTDFNDFPRLRMHEMKQANQKSGETDAFGEKPAYLLDRDEQISAKVLSNTVKQKRAEKAVSIYFNILKLLQCINTLIYLIGFEMCSVPCFNGQPIFWYSSSIVE